MGNYFAKGDSLREARGRTFTQKFVGERIIFKSERFYRDLEREKVATDKEVLWQLEGGLAMPDNSAFRDGAPDTDNPYRAFAARNLGALHMISAMVGPNLTAGSELVGWAAFFPCSLETESFTDEHHRSIFRDFYSDPAEFERTVDAYNSHGRAARNFFDTKDSQRTWHFTHLMFESDLRLVADLDHIEFIACSRETRLGLLDRVRQKLRRANELKLTIAFIPLAEERRIRRTHGFWKAPSPDSLIVVRDHSGKERFTFWRERGGVARHSSEPAVLRRHEQWISELQLAATIVGSEGDALLQEVESLIC